jgi:hypothetical protein
MKLLEIDLCITVDSVTDWIQLVNFVKSEQPVHAMFTMLL